MTQLEKAEAFASNVVKLPPAAYVDDANDGVALVRSGKKGYRPISPDMYDSMTGEEFIRLSNERLGVTPAQREALHWGSMFGFYTPGADPDSYNDDGTLKISVEELGE